VETCASCGTANPVGSKFCNNCGASLAQTVRPRLERKFATALFADLVGSTALAEREDPEVVRSVVSRTFERLAHEIERYEGLLEKFMGDAILAVFGVPRAHEDDAERAVRAALEMQDVLAELNGGFATEGKPTLEMRIGIEAGEVLADLERASGARDRMLTGDAVNTAARLQSAADPGRVVVGPAVYATTKNVIEYRELEPLTLKGKTDPVPAWNAIRVRARTRGERARLGLESRLIGRDEELTVLKQTLKRVEAEGRPALVTVVGAAGVGKSRLVAELEQYVDGLPDVLYWRRGRCLAYGNTSYSAFADAIKAQCEIFDDDPAEIAAKKAEAAARELFGDDSVVPQMLALVGGGETQSMQRDELFEAWRRFLERLATRHPLVLALDDIHWADEGLLDFIEHVADWAQGPIMLVATARAELFETRPTWGGGKRNAASLYLDPLSPAEGETMLRELLPGALSDDVNRAIVERSEGNPLYVEEIVRKLIDDGVLRATAASRWNVARPVEDVEIPRSIQGLIAARLDGLPEDEKAALQDAAVVGRIFWLGAVADLSGRSIGQVREALGRLRVKELVVPHEPSSFRDEHEFAFKHVLIRDGAYESLPKALRADKHAGVARWAEERAGDRAEEIAELVATHELEALRYADELGERRPDLMRRAFDHAWSAARRTRALGQSSESARWYREAERLADALEIPLADRVELHREHLQVSFGPDPVVENERVALRALEAFEAVGDAVGIGWANAYRVVPLMQASRFDEAEAAGRRAVATLEPLGESEELADALQRVGWFLWRRGREKEAEPLLRRAVAMATSVGSIHVLAEAMQSLGVCLQQIDQRESDAVMEEAFVLAKRSGRPTNLMRAYNNIAAARTRSRGPVAVVDVVEEGLNLALRSGIYANAGWITGTLGDTLHLIGRLEEAEEHLAKAVELARRIGDMPLIGMRLSSLAMTVLFRGRVEEALAIWTEARPIVVANPEPQIESWEPMFESYVAYARGDASLAADRAVAAADTARTYGIAGAPEVIPLVVRSLLRVDRPDLAAGYRDLDDLDGVVDAALARNVQGLIEREAMRSASILGEAAEMLDALGMSLLAGLARVDRARAIARAGDDPRPTLEQARDLIETCDARLFLPEIEAGLGIATP
jgi:class 3 adenylate cyclase/tetratricopeptide (TPR) repeat protein